ncbi:MAG: DUF3035 domain-containing protein [Minwuia sp.]|uniref:DUF3035 domain-containing protein n=1 Tax=Minwuia sp. TaxID=2493630 RepID=UPI003A865098
MSRFIKIASVLTVAAGLGACESAKDVLGLSKTSPDESQVTVFSPLVVPPDFGLRPPASGATDTAAVQNLPRRPRSGAVIASDGTIIGGATGEEELPENASAGELAFLRQAGALTPPRGVRALAAQQEQAATRLNRLLTELILFDTDVGARREPKPIERTSIERQGLFF